MEAPLIPRTVIDKLSISRIVNLVRTHLDPGIAVKKSPCVKGQYKWLLYPEGLHKPGQLIAFDTSREAWEYPLVTIDNKFLAQDILADARLYQAVSARHRAVRALAHTYFANNGLRYYQRESSKGCPTHKGIDNRRLFYLMYQQIDQHLATINTLIAHYNVELVLEPYRGEDYKGNQAAWQYASFQDKD